MGAVVRCEDTSELGLAAAGVLGKRGSQRPTQVPHRPHVTVSPLEVTHHQPPSLPPLQLHHHTRSRPWATLMFQPHSTPRRQTTHHDLTPLCAACALEQEITALGGTVHALPCPLSSLEELWGHVEGAAPGALGGPWDAVANCCGIGAAQLLGDKVGLAVP